MAVTKTIDKIEHAEHLGVLIPNYNASNDLATPQYYAMAVRMEALASSEDGFRGVVYNIKTFGNPKAKPYNQKKIYKALRAISQDLADLYQSLFTVISEDVTVDNE